MSPLGSEVITTSASATAAVPVSKVLTPLAAAFSRNSGTRSKPWTVCPPATRLAAIGPPILPSPRKATVLISAYLSLAGGLGAGGFRPADDHAHDLVGPLKDAVHPQIPDDFLQPVLLEVAVSAVQLQG